MSQPGLSIYHTDGEVAGNQEKSDLPWARRSKRFCIKFSETKFLGTVALVWHYVIVVGQQRNVFTVDAHDIK